MRAQCSTSVSLFTVLPCDQRYYTVFRPRQTILEGRLPRGIRSSHHAVVKMPSVLSGWHFRSRPHHGGRWRHSGSLPILLPCLRNRRYQIQIDRHHNHLGMCKLWSVHGGDFEPTRIEKPLGRHRNESSTAICETRNDRASLPEGGNISQAATMTAVTAR